MHGRIQRSNGPREAARSGPRSCRLTLALLGLAVFPACSDPFGFEARRAGPEQEDICPSSEEWIPNTPTVDLYNPLPRPSSKCPFYRGAWQNFLVATKPDGAGRLALQDLPTIDTLFQPARPLGMNRAWLGGIRQPGSRQILLDQNGRSLYYGTHTNQAFAEFVNRNGLRTKDAIQNADPNLFFPAGVVSYKSAWQEVNPADPTLDRYITTRAAIAVIRKQANGDLREDRDNPREALVRLLALHVVFTLPGHPEFIWGTFEHSDGTPDTTVQDGKRNVAPNMPRNPSAGDPTNQRDTSVVCAAATHLLCKPGTTANQGNQPIAEAMLRFDEPTQSFPGQQTSVYRMFPASRSNTVVPDAALTSLNHNVEQLFAKGATDGRVAANDKRGHYRLVGALWMDKPAYLEVDSSIQDDSTSKLASVTGFQESIDREGAGSPLSLLAGENRLSSTAIESFTQASDSFSNCFACHNTRAVTAKGLPANRDPGGQVVMMPKLINLSRVFSEFVLGETQAAPAVQGQ